MREFPVPAVKDLHNDMAEYGKGLHGGTARAAALWAPFSRQDGPANDDERRA